jgi:hypothetical protein
VVGVVVLAVAAILLCALEKSLAPLSSLRLEARAVPLIRAGSPPGRGALVVVAAAAALLS